MIGQKIQKAAVIARFNNKKMGVTLPFTMNENLTPINYILSGLVVTKLQAALILLVLFCNHR